MTMTIQTEKVHRKPALIIVGHVNSEEAGMAYLVEWLHKRFPDLSVAHVPAGDAFQYM